MFILSQLLNQEVVADKLVVQNGGSQLRTRALNAISQFIEGSNCVIAINDALTLLVKTAKEVEGIERHEPARVKCVSEKLSERLN